MPKLKTLVEPSGSLVAPSGFNSILSAGTANATDITAIEAANGTGTINGSALTAINGTYDQIAQALVDLDTDPTNFNSTLSAQEENATAITALKAANGTGTIDGSALTGINGAYHQIVQALADLDTKPTNFNSTLSAGAANAEDITALEAANGTGHINGSNLAAINGTAAAVVQAIADLDTDPTNFNSTLSAGTAKATDIIAIEAANGTGQIDGSDLTAIDGSAAKVVQAIADLDVDPFNFDSILTGAATAADITAIEAANGTGEITGAGLTAISGTAAAVKQAIADLDTDPHLPCTSTLAPGSKSATAITALKTAYDFHKIPGTINGSALTAINGTAAAVKQAIADLDTKPTNFNSTLSAGAAAAADIIYIETNNGNGTINGSALTAINGDASGVEDAIYALDTDPTNFNSTLTGAANAHNITAIEAFNGTGTIDGSNLTAINGTAAGIVQAITDLDSDPFHFNSKLSVGAADAADINTIEAANGTGTIDGSELTAINGRAKYILQALSDLDTDPTNFNSKLSSGAADASFIITLASKNGTGFIDGSDLTAIDGSAVMINKALTYLDEKPTNFDSTLTGAVNATDITGLNNVGGLNNVNGTGKINGFCYYSY